MQAVPIIIAALATRASQKDLAGKNKVCPRIVALHPVHFASFEKNFRQ
jgi:hypothetical protein